MKNIDHYCDAIVEHLKTTSVLNLSCAVFDIRTGTNECGDCDAGILSGWVKTSEVNLSDLPPFHPDCCCSVEFSNEKPKGRK